MPITGWFWDPDPNIKIVYQNEPHCFYSNDRLCSIPIWFCRKTDKKYNWFTTFKIYDRGELYYINIFSRTVFILSRVILHLNTLFSHWHIKWCKTTASFLSAPWQALCRVKGVGAMVQLSANIWATNGGWGVDSTLWREGSKISYQGIDVDVHSSVVREFWENIS